MQGLGLEEAHLPEDSVLRPLWEKRVPLGSSQKSCVLMLVGARPGEPWRLQVGQSHAPLLQDPNSQITHCLLPGQSQTPLT